LSNKLFEFTKLQHLLFKFSQLLLFFAAFLFAARCCFYEQIFKSL